jgi:hypothetical protein
MRQANAQWKQHMRGLGVLTLNHEAIGAALFKEVSGTSLAAPYITHLAGRLLNEYPTASANLLRAMLVNQAYLPDEVTASFSEEFKKSYKEAKSTYNRDVARDVAGYGVVSDADLFKSSDNVVVLMSEETIENDGCQFFELPLPVDYLRSARGTRELSITLAYSPVVRTTRIEYLATQINFRLAIGTSLDEVQKHFSQELKTETEVLKEAKSSNRDISSQLRSRGTVQSSRWTLRQCKPGEKWFVVVVRQDRDWNPSAAEREPYSLVVTVADRDNEHAQLYTQIQERIAQQAVARERQEAQQVARLRS